MSLTKMWNENKSQFLDKSIKQIISFAGDGNLRDDSQTSIEIREFLRNINSNTLANYAEQCLMDKFDDSGFVLQDIVNEIGHRLGFAVSHGRYRGSRNHSGHDGIWMDENGNSIIIEVKTTDVYRIDLNTIANYRTMLSKEDLLKKGNSSMLIVVGRQDTGDLEAQIRGSKHAWEMRLISVEALLKMLHLKEEMGDPLIINKIHQILIPCEFTRLDKIVDIAFAVVEDVKQEEETEENRDEIGEKSKKFTPVNFNEACIQRIEKNLKITLVKQSRALFASPDGSIRIICAVSRLYVRSKGYWFAFHPHQQKFLLDAQKSYVSFGCGNPQTLFMIPLKEFTPWLENCNQTKEEKGIYWHIIIHQVDNNYKMIGRKGSTNFDITKYFVND
jgi:hypothetical protein